MKTDLRDIEITMLAQINTVHNDPNLGRKLACEEGASRLAYAVFGRAGESKIPVDADRTQHVAALIRSGMVVYRKTDKRASRYEVSPAGLKLLERFNLT